MSTSLVDQLARGWATARSRRQAVKLAAGALVVAGIGGVRAVTARQTICRGAGEPCTLGVRCCAGLTCETLATNPNAGFCSGGDARSTATPTSTLASSVTPTATGTTATRTPTPRATSTRAASTSTPAPTRTPTATSVPPTATATPTPPATDDLRLRLVCNQNPEKTIISNTSDVTVVIRTISSTNNPGDDEPITVNERLAAGRTRTYESGSAAQGNVLTDQFIYNNVTGDGAIVRTSAGTIRARCG